MKRASVLVLYAPVLVSACVGSAPTPLPPGDPGPDACGASGLQYMVGKPGVLLDGMRFSRDVRVIAPGMAVTMDYSATRLNFWLDRRDVIQRVSCG
jgi:hypothetical protein